MSVFMHLLDMHIACALQVYQRLVNGVIREPGKLSIVELVTPEAVLEQIAILNPVEAGLVYEPEDWPGVTASVQDLAGARGRRAPRLILPGPGTRTAGTLARCRAS